MIKFGGVIFKYCTIKKDNNLNKFVGSGYL